MFRSTEKGVAPAIKKATSETLTQDNWEYILDACDAVSSDPESGARNAISAIEQRLALKDGNVLLRTLSLITALAENCGSKMKQEIATKKFCNILKSLISNPHTYPPIKVKIFEMIEQLSKSFKGDPSLRIIGDTYKDIKLSYPDLAASSFKPQKPQKHEMTDTDKLKEQEELDLALKLSLQEYESKQNVSQPMPQAQQQQQQQQPQPPQVQPASNQTVSENDKSNIATVSRVRALYDLSSHEPDELSFKKGDIITVIESVYRDWWRGSLRGKIGIFPLNYVTPLKEPTTEEMMAELKAEHQLLTKSTEVEKLLSLLSNFSSRMINNKVSNEELSAIVQDAQLSALFKDVVGIRPQLTSLIEKYSVKKDEMVALNEKLINSERLYNELMESSFNRYMANRAQPQYPPNQFMAPGNNAQWQQQNPFQYQAPPAQQPAPPAQQPAQQPLQQPLQQQFQYHAQGYPTEPPANYPPSAPQEQHASSAAPPYPQYGV